jgi:predicted phage terminase large subunit-like protein
MKCKIPIENEQDRKKRMELLKKKIKISLDLKESGKLSTDELIQLKKEIDEYKEIESVERCRYSLLEFAYEFFSEDKNADFFDSNVIPKGVTIDDAPQFHRELCGYLDKIAYSTEGERVCYSVPRGFSKSTFASQLFPLFLQAFRLPASRFILIVSESLQGAQKFIDFSRNAIKFHERFREVFGEGLHENAKQNERDNSTSYISSFKNPYTNRGIRSLVLASGVGGQLRGATFSGKRVTMVVADDLESSKSVNTKELREATWNFWTQVIDPIGEPTSNFILIGTCVHGQGLINSISKRADFTSKTYAAITEYPGEKSRSYWDKFEEIYRDLENPNREYEADQYYLKNKEIMDSEVKTLWDRFSYADLMKMKVNMGTRAFFSEMLNIPADKSNSVFSEEDIHYYEEHELPRNLEIYAFWDVAISGTGDRNGIVVIGRSRKTGLLYILDAKLLQIKMHEGLEVAISVAKRWRPRFFGVEVVQAQIEMKRQLESRLYKEGVYNVHVKGIRPRGNKKYRIESMQPLVENGTLRFKKGQSQQLLIEEMLSFPHGDTDDGIDSAQQCINMIKLGRGFFKKPEGA